MTFRQMEVFVKICEEKSINKAASALIISQQGLSKMIQELELELGCALLDRSPKGVIPTQCGQYFLGECRNIIDKKDFLTNHIAHIKEFPQEIISLGMSFGVIAVIHYKNILSFENNYPNVKIEYHDQVDYYLEYLFHKGEYDFCINTGILDSDSFQYEEILKEKVYLSVPVGHPFFNKTAVTMKDLEGKGFAMFSSQFHIRHKFDLCCEKAGVSPVISLSSNDFNSLKEVAKENSLLFLQPQHTINPDDHGVRFLPFPDAELTWNIYFIRRKDKALSEYGKCFYRFLKESVQHREQNHCAF